MTIAVEGLLAESLSQHGSLSRFVRQRKLEDVIGDGRGEALKGPTRWLFLGERRSGHELSRWTPTRHSFWRT